jgi:hypothetical protein
MIAFQKNLIAPADAHHLVANFGEPASWIAGTQQYEDCDGQSRSLYCVATSYAEFRK